MRVGNGCRCSTPLICKCCDVQLRPRQPNLKRKQRDRDRNGRREWWLAAAFCLDLTTQLPSHPLNESGMSLQEIVNTAESLAPAALEAVLQAAPAALPSSSHAAVLEMLRFHLSRALSERAAAAAAAAVGGQPSGGDSHTVAAVAVRTSCACKKDGCKTKRCPCKKAGVACGVRCACSDCSNTGEVSDATQLWVEAAVLPIVLNASHCICMCSCRSHSSTYYLTSLTRLMQPHTAADAAAAHTTPMEVECE